jgi:hypothetical protein
MELIKRLINCWRSRRGWEDQSAPIEQTQPGPNDKCVILVPVAHHIEPACDEALRELERRGYIVWRRWGYSAIDQGRCLMAQQALEAGFEELLWIDADVAFWPDDVEKIRSLGKPIVAAAYPVKGWPTMTLEPLDKSVPIRFGPHPNLVALRYAATGFLYTQARVYRSIQNVSGLAPVLIWGQHEAFPWFYPILKDGEYLGEDFAFCHRAREEAGFEIFLDPSIRLAHIGRYSYSWEYASRGVRTEPSEWTYHPAIHTRETAGN